jgi:hypothetical protein
MKRSASSLLFDFASLFISFSVAVLLSPKRSVKRLSKHNAAYALTQPHGRRRAVALHAASVASQDVAASASSSAASFSSLASQAAAAAHDLGASAQSLKGSAIGSFSQCSSAATTAYGVACERAATAGQHLQTAAGTAAEIASQVKSVSAVKLAQASQGATGATIAAADWAQQAGTAVNGLASTATGFTEACLGASGSFLLEVYRKQFSIEDLVLVTASTLKAVVTFLAVRVNFQLCLCQSLTLFCTFTLHSNHYFESATTLIS